jgi:hypothetical protein
MSLSSLVVVLNAVRAARVPEDRPVDASDPARADLRALPA